MQTVGDDILSKYVPAHVNIFYCFGGLVLTSFIIQAASGIALTIYFRPTVVEAFSSVEQIVTSVNMGWVIRSVHRWSSGIMFQVLILHVSRVYMTGGTQEAQRDYMGYRNTFSTYHTIIWGYWLLITLGPSSLLGMQDSYSHSRGIR